MIQATSQFVLKHQDQYVYLITLENSRGMRVELSNYGGLIKSIIVPDKHGQPTDVVLGFDKLEDYFSPHYLAVYPYLGTVIGRYANRVSHAQFSIDNKKYTLSANAVPHQIHGGTEGFDKKVWKIKSLSESPEPQLVLSYWSPDGEEGFPGNLSVDLTLTLTAANELKLDMQASTDQDTAINLTHHGYFNLNGDGASVDEHQVCIAASHYLAQDQDYLPTGDLIAVEGTSHDFRSLKAIQQDWNLALGYDQAFVLDHQGLTHLAAEAYSPQSGIRMELFTDQPAIQFYTAKYLSHLKGKNGLTYGPFSGFCFEDQVQPNAINIPGFPNTVLRAGEIYRHQTLYRFGT